MHELAVGGRDLRRGPAVLALCPPHREGYTNDAVFSVIGYAHARFEVAAYAACVGCAARADAQADNDVEDAEACCRWASNESVKA